MSTMALTDPTTSTSEPGRYWTTANIGEATPDVLSPLCWSFWGPNMEAAARQSYHDFGILSKRELTVPSDPNQLLTSYFYGRPAMNLDLLRALFGSLPGVSADDFERDICGKVRPGLADEKRTARLPFIIARGPVAMATTGRLLTKLYAEQSAWWTAEVSERRDVGDPRARLADAAARFRHAFHIHVRGRFVLMSAQAKIYKLAMSIDRVDAVMGLLTGIGGVTETTIADDLWLVSRGRLRIEQFVRRWGFHGPQEGNLTSHSWREDSLPVTRLVESLAARPDDQRPLTREATGVAAREAAIESFVAALPRLKQFGARRVCAALATGTRDNELGKASYLMAIDGGRAAARDLGRQLVAEGVLDDVDDVFCFTLDELSRTLPSNAREVVAFRQARRDEYRALELPLTFTGDPVPERIGDIEVSDDVVITGVAGSTGSVEGIARVITDPDAADSLADGEILVCRFTDPSWAPLFLFAAALVIDIGASASHGAIVARELGIPCVIGTGDGTRRIRSGDRIAVDGAIGEVRILKRASELA